MEPHTSRLYLTAHTTQCAHMFGPLKPGFTRRLAII